MRKENSEMRKIRLLKNGIKIDGQAFKIGDLVKAVDKDGKVQFEGEVEFGVYSDGEVMQTTITLDFSWKTRFILYTVILL